MSGEAARGMDRALSNRGGAPSALIRVSALKKDFNGRVFRPDRAWLWSTRLNPFRQIASERSAPLKAPSYPLRAWREGMGGGMLFAEF